MNSLKNNEKAPYSVLVIDDEESIVQVCEYVLEKAGHEVYTAKSGFLGLEILQSVPKIDIILTDLKMPNMSGHSVLKAVKRDWPHVQVMMMTGFATIEYAIEAMKSGAADFILKPLSAEQIRIAVDKCIEKIELNREIHELKLANKKLQELKDMEEKFLAITSHELRTPISHIKGYFGILSDDFVNQMDEEEVNECKNIVRNAIQDLEELLASMSDVLRFKQNRIELRFEEFDVGKLLYQIQSAFRLSLEERHLSLEVDNGANGILITADRLKVKVMLTELIKNAIKFTKDGGEIFISSEQDKRFCHISVKDSGIGIPDSEQGKIFKPFYEVQPSDYHHTGDTTFMAGGLGIGLTQVKEIVKAHNGEIKVDSQVDVGTVMKVSLPLEQEGAY
ncbi:MAG: response regulator [Calditrichaeota bacterium]|nr:MAG: response regulator [Calditrichota bacterium]